MISIDQITTQIYLGSTPYSVSDAKVMVEDFAINSVLSLQSDEDISDRKIPLPELRNCYKDQSVEFKRFAIKDFDVEGLAKKLYEPTLYLAQEIKQGKSVFVHCNSGICRAPSTVLAYLVAYEEYSIEEGLSLMRLKRPIVNPYIPAIEKVLERISHSE
jgi:predicted protein tyrosine phosphatase